MSFLLIMLLRMVYKNRTIKQEGNGMNPIEAVVASSSVLALMLVIYQFGQMFN